MLAQRKPRLRSDRADDQAQRGKAVKMDRKDSGSDELVADAAAAGAMAERGQGGRGSSERFQDGPPAPLHRRHRCSARRAADRFRQGHAGRPLPAARRELPGHVRPRRRLPTPTTQEHAQRLYDYISKLWFMPATPVLSNGGTDRGLPISCFLNSVGDSLEGIVGTWNENVWLASQRRRHRHLLGRRPLHRREGRAQRPDQRHHPLHPGDGLADAGDQPGLAAPRLGRRLSRHPPPGDRGVPRDPQALGRLQPQGAQPAPRHARSPTSSWKRCATAPSSTCASPKDGSVRARSTPARCCRSCSRPAWRPASPTSSSPTP